MKKILITGAKGFLGSHISKYFKNLKFETYGIGHGDLLVEECRMIGLDYWFKSDVNIKAIKEINQKFDVVIHCGGSGSVGFSMENPYEDFKKTVDGTLEVLEYIRLYNPNAHLIYPSSPAVLGECNDEPIAENYIGKPVSPYGYHKKIAEDLCQSYSEKYDIKVSIVRLFSVYGNGLRKQLLWDAYNKMILSNGEVEFWGTGMETRDFIHVDDVMDLFLKMLAIEDKFIILNGGSGVKDSVCDVVNLIKEILHSDIKIVFNNQRNLGNPIYYMADISKTKKLGWEPVVNFNQGVKEYIKWVKNQK
ncbi:MAG: NAD-dependent epimerase/dehydratase family protein [Sulfurimonas sp.]|uniref:NAD-dependent epimerase/dehydratase family protein n=1 Tax=Sulfurimonas sp. TaxID=2022749 RepID=UPI001BB884F9|nr:NAD-dependent epimerase/dehydratase family protein [Sulfurimonas sp.]MBS4067763.1 NAD-dependent epimerase/dehydratase family protein [Sulfurimonas sp.]MDD3854345.1 NAD-dependent epimerase/dehydratase family protein [Sulfurimonas sp.]